MHMHIILPQNYFQSIWNSYEFVIALGSILEVILQLTIENSANEEVGVPKHYFITWL